MSEVEQRPRLVMAGYSWQWSQWVNLSEQPICRITVFNVILNRVLIEKTAHKLIRETPF